MKKLLLGLLFLGSISSYAETQTDLHYRCIGFPDGTDATVDAYTTLAVDLFKDQDSYKVSAVYTDNTRDYESKNFRCSKEIIGNEINTNTESHSATEELSVPCPAGKWGVVATSTSRNILFSNYPVKTRSKLFDKKIIFTSDNVKLVLNKSDSISSTLFSGKIKAKDFGSAKLQCWRK